MLNVETLIKELSKMPAKLEIRVRYPTGYVGEAVVKRVTTKRMGKIEVDKNEDDSGLDDYIEIS